MTEILRAIVLGLIQGVTEFLPVSSDGHLLLVRRLFGWSDEGLAFDTVLHLGTFLAVLVAYRTRWFNLLRSLTRSDAQDDRRLLFLVVLATIPGAVVGYFAEDVVGSDARTLSVTAAGFLASAVLLALGDLVARRHSAASAPSLSSRTALGIGVLQVLALLPGLSRSGATIAGGLIAGLSRERAVEFSFLLAAPIVGGAGFYGLLQWGENGAQHPLALGLGALAAFLSGIFAIRFLLRYVRAHSFLPFIAYLVVVALVSFVFQ